MSTCRIKRGNDFGPAWGNFGLGAKSILQLQFNSLNKTNNKNLYSPLSTVTQTQWHHTGATGSFFQIHRMRNTLEPSLCPLQLVLYSKQYWLCSHVIFSSVRWRGSRVSSGKYPGLRLSKPSSRPRVPFNSCLLQLRSAVSALQLRFPQVSNSSRDTNLLGLLGVIKWDHLWRALCTQ